MIKLNPLIKIENLADSQCVVKLLLERKSYKLNRDLLFFLIQEVENNHTLEQTKINLLQAYPDSTTAIEQFLQSLYDKHILVEDLDQYPIADIEYWKKHKWLNALIYHLESQNIDCYDDGTRLGEDNKTYANNADLQTVLWKQYIDAPVISLPNWEPNTFTDIPIEEVLLARNSFSPFRKKPIALTDLTNILAAANRDLCANRNHYASDEKAFYQSAFTALETYLFAFAVEGLANGLYHYAPNTHTLSLLQAGDFKEAVVNLCIGQHRAAAGGCLFLITANPKRYMLRYKHERAYRNMLVNVAEFAHQYIFYSTALGYSTFLTPAIKDDFASQLLAIDYLQELPLYTVGIG